MHWRVWIRCAVLFCITHPTILFPSPHPHFLSLTPFIYSIYLLLHLNEMPDVLKLKQGCITCNLLFVLSPWTDLTVRTVSIRFVWSVFHWLSHQCPGFWHQRANYNETDEGLDRKDAVPFPNALHPLHNRQWNWNGLECGHAHRCYGHIQSLDMIRVLCYLILWERGGISGLKSSTLLFYSSFYVNVSFNKLWCLLFICGLESSWEGGFLDGVICWFVERDCFLFPFFFIKCGLNSFV